jgi:hypothetical protein
MNWKQINKIAHNFVELAKNDAHINEIEFLGYHIIPKDIKDKDELMYFKAINLLNFYEGEIKREAPLTYNLIITDIANIIKNGNRK